MRKFIQLLLLVIFVAGCQTRMLEQDGAISVEPSNRSGSDYLIKMRNLVDFGFNPDNEANRHKWALKYIAKQCPDGRVVDDSSIDTGQYLTGKRSKTYFVYIRC